MDDPKSVGVERIAHKYRAVAANAQLLEQKRLALEREIDAASNKAAEMANTKPSDFVSTGSEEMRTKLRLLIAQRIKKIEMRFKKTGKKVAKMTFANGLKIVTGHWIAVIGMPFMFRNPGSIAYTFAIVRLAHAIKIKAAFLNITSEGCVVGSPDCGLFSVRTGHLFNLGTM